MNTSFPSGSYNNSFSFEETKFEMAWIKTSITEVPELQSKNSEVKSAEMFEIVMEKALLEKIVTIRAMSQEMFSVVSDFSVVGNSERKNYTMVT